MLLLDNTNTKILILQDISLDSAKQIIKLIYFNILSTSILSQTVMERLDYH